MDTEEEATMTHPAGTHYSRLAAIIIAFGSIMTGLEAQPVDNDPNELRQYRARRAEAAGRERRITFNNDGDDHILRGDFSMEAFLEQRSTPLIGSKVDSIVYCTSRPFGLFLHQTQVGDVFLERDAFGPDGRNVVGDLLELGTDPLQAMVEFCRRQDLEIIWSMRMNDTHDSPHTPERPHYYWSSFKQQHPEALLGSREQRPAFGSWVAVDYADPAVQDFLLRAFEEVCQGYDVDGLELDFFRHLVYFRSVAAGGRATQEEVQTMTELVRRVRHLTEVEGMRRGRPILLTARVPDSLGFCMAMGLDLATWLDEGLLDGLVAAGDFRLNSWDYSVALGKRYGVSVYADIDPFISRGQRARFDRNSLEALRGRALEAWDAGAAGIYLFNHFNPRHPLWWELGDPESLRRRDRLHFANVKGKSGYLTAAGTLAGGNEFDARPPIHPDSPLVLKPGEAIQVPVMVGGEVAGAAPAPELTLHVLSAAPEPPAVTLNGHGLAAEGIEEGWADYPLAAGQVRAGENTVQITMADRPLSADRWDVEYLCDTAPPSPWRRDRLTATSTATMQDDALLIADTGTEAGTYLYYVYPWSAQRSDRATFEAVARVVSGSNMIIVADGVAEEEVRLYPDRVELGRAGLVHPMVTDDAFHIYRVELEGADIRLYVDDVLVLEAPGGFVSPAHAGRNVAMFGASMSGTTGEALWKGVRLRTGTISVQDVVVSVRHGDG